MTRILLVIGTLLAAITAVPAAAAPGVVQISGLSNMAFGTTNFIDSTMSETVCAYSTVALSQYSVTATGSGPGGALSMSNGTYNLPYEVQWNQVANQTSGQALAANSALTGQRSGATTPGCTLGLTSSGSLIVTLRAAELTKADAGNYQGTLTIILAAN